MVLNFKLHLSFKLIQNKNPKHHLQTKGVHSNTVFNRSQRVFYMTIVSQVSIISLLFIKKRCYYFIEKKLGEKPPCCLPNSIALNMQCSL